MEDKERKLIEYIAKAAEEESALLYSHPSFYLFAAPLLDEIGKIFNIDQQEISRCIDETLFTKEVTEGEKHETDRRDVEKTGR